MTFLPRLKAADVAGADRPAPARVGARMALEASPEGAAANRIERDIRKRRIDLGDQHQVRLRQAQRRPGRIRHGSCFQSTVIRAVFSMEPSWINEICDVERSAKYGVC